MSDTISLPTNEIHPFLLEKMYEEMEKKRDFANKFPPNTSWEIMMPLYLEELDKHENHNE